MSGVNICGNEIPWAFVMKVRRIVGGDWDVVQDIFWKAKNARGGSIGIMKYVMAGFKRSASGAVPYNLQPSRERESGQMHKIRGWWTSSVYQPKKQNSPMSMKDIFAAIAAGRE